MIITPRDTPDLLAAVATSTAERSPGLHMSDLYNDLYAALHPSRYGQGTPPNPMRLALGLAWETHLEAALLRAGIHAERPGEFQTSQGIAYSPDLLIYDADGTPRLGEIKLTWMRDTGDLADPRYAKWLTQTKAYCYHLGLNRAAVLATFINGDYRGQRDPVLRWFNAEFSQRELVENWTTLKNHGQHRGLL